MYSDDQVQHLKDALESLRQKAHAAGNIDLLDKIASFGNFDGRPPDSVLSEIEKFLADTAKEDRLKEEGNPSETDNRLSPLLNKLRELRKHNPTLDELEIYRSQIDHVLADIAYITENSSEANEARLEQVNTSQIIELNKELQRLQNNVKESYEDNNLVFTDMTHQGVKSLFGKITDHDFGRFNVARDALQSKIAALFHLSDTHRNEVIARHGNQATIAALEGLLAVLDDLVQRRGKGQPHAENPQKVVVQIDIAITEWTEEYRKFCVSKIKDRVEVIDKLLKDPTDRLAEAENLLTEIQRFLGDKYVHKSLSDVEDQIDESGRQVSMGVVAQRCQQRVEDVWKEREETEKVITKALKVASEEKDSNPLKGLDVLSVEATYTKHPKLKQTRDHLIDLTRRKLMARIRSDITLADTTARTGERDYKNALIVLNQAEFLINESQREGLDLSNLINNVQSKRNELAQESDEWESFYKKLLEVQGNITRGLISEKSSKSILDSFTAHEQQVFAREWNDLKTLLAKNAPYSSKLTRADELFKQNPTDKEIANLLDIEGFLPDQEKKRKELLNRHRAWTALSNLRRSTKSVAQLANDAAAWKKDVDHLVDAISVNTGTFALDEQLGQEAEKLRREGKELKTIAEEMHRVQTESNAGLRSGNPTVGLDKLNERLRIAESEKAGDLAEHYRLMRDHARVVLRNKRMPEIQDIIKQWHTNRQQLTKEIVDHANQIKLDLEKYEALIEDGDGLRAEKICQIWHARWVETILDFGSQRLEDINDTAFVTKLKEVSLEDWTDLLSHLKGVADQGLPDNNKVRRRARDLWEIARCLRAMGIDPKQGIELLQQEGDKEIRAPVAVAMTFLFLSNGKAQEARQVVEQLRRRGDSLKVTRILDEIVDLIEFFDKENKEVTTTIQHLQEQANRLKSDDLFPWYRNALDSIVAELAHELEDKVGNYIYDKAMGIDTSRDPYGFFERLRLLRRALAYVGRHRSKVMVQIQICEQKIGTSAQKLPNTRPLSQRLLDEVNRLLNVERGDLLEMKEQGERYSEYLDDVIPLSPTSSNRAKPSAKELKEALDSRLRDWQTVCDDIEAVRKDLRFLLNGNWDWNDDPKQEPLKVLNAARTKLETAVNTLGEFVSNEVENLEDFYAKFKRGIGEIVPAYKNFRGNFEGDKYTTWELMNQAMKNLKIIEEKTQQVEGDLNKCGREALGSEPVIVLRNFYHVMNPLLDFDRTTKTDLHWVYKGAIGKSENLTDVEMWLNRRMTSATRWKVWVNATNERAKETLEKINLARGDLRGGHLRRAETLCAEMNQCLAGVDEQKKGLMDIEPPYGKLALVESRTIDEEVFPAGSVGEADSSLDELGPLEIPRAWQTLLVQILEMMHNNLDKLVAECNENRAKLESQITRLDTHKRVTMRSPSSNSQTTYNSMIEVAERLDRDDSRVKDHRNEHRRREELLGKGRA